MISYVLTVVNKICYVCQYSFTELDVAVNVSLPICNKTTIQNYRFAWSL